MPSTRQLKSLRAAHVLAWGDAGPALSTLPAAARVGASVALVAALARPSVALGAVLAEVVLAAALAGA